MTRFTDSATGFVFERRADEWPPPSCPDNRRSGQLIQRLMAVTGATRHDILVDAPTCGRLIGPAGTIHREMTQKTGANIVIMDKMPPPAAPAEKRLVVIVGTPQQCIAAATEVNIILAQVEQMSSKFGYQGKVKVEKGAPLDFSPSAVIFEAAKPLPPTAPPPPPSQLSALAPQLFPIDPGGPAAADGEEEGAADAYVVFTDEATGDFEFRRRIDGWSQDGSRVKRTLDTKPGHIRHDMLVPSGRACANIIGPRGAHFKSLEERTSCKVFLGDRDPIPGGDASKRLCTLVGKPADVVTASKEVTRLVEEAEGGKPNFGKAVDPLDELAAEVVADGHVREIFTVSTAAMGRLLGGDGSVMAKLRDESKCKVVSHQGTLLNRPGLRALLIAGEAEAVKQGEALVRKALGNLAHEMRRPAEAAPKEFKAEKLTFIPFKRGVEQVEGVEAREAPGEGSVFKNERGQDVIKVGSEVVRLSYEESRGARNARPDQVALVAGLGFAHQIERCERCGMLGHSEARCKFSAAESRSPFGAPLGRARDDSRRSRSRSASPRRRTARAREAKRGRRRASRSRSRSASSSSSASSSRGRRRSGGGDKEKAASRAEAFLSSLAPAAAAPSAEYGAKLEIEHKGTLTIESKYKKMLAGSKGQNTSWLAATAKKRAAEREAAEKQEAVQAEEMSRKSQQLQQQAAMMMATLQQIQQQQQAQLAKMQQAQPVTQAAVLGAAHLRMLGWQQMTDPATSRVFWHHTASGVTSWLPPLTPQPQSAAHAGDGCAGHAIGADVSVDEGDARVRAGSAAPKSGSWESEREAAFSAWVAERDKLRPSGPSDASPPRGVETAERAGSAAELRGGSAADRRLARLAAAQVAAGE